MDFEEAVGGQVFSEEITNGALKRKDGLIGLSLHLMSLAAVEVFKNVHGGQ